MLEIVPRTAARTFLYLLLALLCLAGWIDPVCADTSSSITVGQSVKNDESPALRDMPPLPLEEMGEQAAKEANENPALGVPHKDVPDPVIQDAATSLRGLVAPLMPGPTLSFDGIGFPGVSCSCAPPDTNGEIGLTQYVQMVNEGFQVFNKATGASVLGPVGISTLWSGFGGVCANNGGGDPIVLYDQLADRWIITQFAGTSYITDECIAVSTTGDATGSYYRYDFTLGTGFFFDYPHLAVWPDGYYMAMAIFNTAVTAYQGPQAFVFDRAKMLIGAPATFQTPGITGGPTEAYFLPADLDGYSLPPANPPNTFVEYPNSGTYTTWHFHVDWVTPANSFFSLFALPPAAGFTALCPGTRSCVPQLGTTDGLDGLGGRMMYRLAYRNIGGVESLVGNQTVSANSVAGLRWFELRGVTAGPVTVFQQSTYQPDTTWRWMGSAAMDNKGDLALAYSASSSTINPQIRYAGRLATDPVNTLAQGEAHLFDGTGSQTGTGNRWGDYSDLTVDPSDDCTFWYTQEYYAVTGKFGWRTRIGNIKYPTCTTSQRGTISGTITNCQTGVPVPGALVTIQGGYSRPTSTAGTFSAIVAPGTYAASVTGAGYDTVSRTGLVVANGGNATLNACLNGLVKQPVADTANVVSIGCGANGTIDPNGVVTVGLGVKNVGTLSTANLVGTLQATGGVTNPSAPQSYGAVAAGGSTVSRSFTFTTGGLTCGDPLVLTLQLQDGATNLGTVTYGSIVGIVSSDSHTTGNIAVNVPDNNAIGVDIPVDVPYAFTITDVNVSFRLAHAFDGDLKVSLVHPDGTVVPLVASRGGSGDDFGTGANDCSGAGTVFDDDAATLVSAGAAPFSGSFKPESPLSAFNGKYSSGTWMLRVLDGAASDVGTVGCVKLELNKSVACCGPAIKLVQPLVIASESVSPANLAADPEETVAVYVTFQNDGPAPTTNLVATLLPTGGVAAPSGPAPYGAIPFGGSITQPFWFAAQGSCGGTVTLTFALQDGATNLGTRTYAMPLGTTTTGVPQTFSNAAPIAILDAAAASPYPSTINVSGVAGAVAKVTVALNGLNHTYPSDVDMLLVGPAGQAFVLLSDAVGSADWVNVNYVLDDAAASFVPSNGTPVSGTFKPTNYAECADPFGAPAPAGPYLSPGGATVGAKCGSDTLASAFAGQAANGAWSLYVLDDSASDSGSIAGGWSITITPTVSTCATQACSVTAPTSVTQNGCGGVVYYSPAPVFNGSCGATVIDPPDGSVFGPGTRTVLVRGTRADGTFTDASFPVTVQTTETQSTPAGSAVGNNFCDVSVVFGSVGSSGSTTVANAPQPTLPAPYTRCTSCPELQVTTTAGFTPPVQTCVRMPADMDASTFARLRILHAEPGFVDRTTGRSLATRTVCAQTSTLSPFVVALAPSACSPLPNCDDGNPCTADSCDPALSCVHANATGACSDGNACTSPDACAAPAECGTAQSFDGVTAPALPSGWTAAGTGNPWTTVASSSDTAPNSAFTDDPTGVTDKSLVSPPIAIASTAATVTFRNRYLFNNTFDGGILEIKIGAGAFTDIVAAGGAFTAGGYTGLLSNQYGNPIGGRNAWTGTSAGYPAYLTTSVVLPAAAAGQTIQLRWRVATDVSVGGTGQNIDSIVIGDQCPAACTAGPAIGPPAETANVLASADKATYSWSATASATQYDVVRGSTGAFPVGPGAGDETCFANLAGATLTDAAVPAPGAGFFYLSRGANACGIGTFGNQSNGSPRTTTCP